MQAILVIFLNIFGLLFFTLTLRKLKISLLHLFPLHLGVIGTFTYIFSLFTLFKEGIYFLTIFFLASDCIILLRSNFFNEIPSIISKKISQYSIKKIDVKRLFFWLLILFFYLLVFWESNLIPETVTDSLYYHLPTAKYIAIENKLPVYDQIISYSELPLQSYIFSSIIHTFYAIFFYANLEVLIYLLPPLASIYIFFLIRSIGKNLYNRKKYVGFSLLLIPVFFSLSSVTYMDIFSALIIISSLQLLIKFYRNNRIQYFYISSILLGIGASIKIIHLILLIPFMYVIISNKKINRNQIVISYLLFVSFASIIPLKNLLILGNPIYPYFNTVLIPLFSNQIIIVFLLILIFLIIPLSLFFFNLIKSEKLVKIIYINICIILIFLPILSNFRIFSGSDLNSFSTIYNKTISSLYSAFYVMRPGSPHLSFGLIVPFFFMAFLLFRLLKKNPFKEEEKIILLFSLFVFISIFFIPAAEQSFVRYSFPFFILGTVLTDEFILISYSNLKRINISSIKTSVKIFKKKYNLTQVLFCFGININLMISVTFWFGGVKGINQPLLYKFYNPLATDSEDYEHWRDFEMQVINYINNKKDFNLYLVLGYELFLLEDHVNFMLPILGLKDDHIPREPQDSLEYLRNLGISYLAVLNSYILLSHNNYNSLVNYLIDNNRVILLFEDQRGSTGLFSALFILDF